MLVRLQKIGWHGLGIIENRQRTGRIGIKVFLPYVQNHLRVR